MFKLKTLFKRIKPSYNVMFVDVDGVLNNDTNLYDDVALNDELISNVCMVAQAVQAKIVLSSSWRCHSNPLKRVMDAFRRHGMVLYGITAEGVSETDFQKTKYKDVPRTQYYDWEEDMRFDRGAEIAVWLNENPQVDKFLIIDDDIKDIEPYFPKENILKTNFKDGFTREDTNRAYLFFTKE